MCANENQAKIDTVEFFVSIHGNDAWSGRIAETTESDGPFATIERAQQEARNIRKTQPQVSVRVTLSVWSGRFRHEGGIRYLCVCGWREGNFERRL